MSGWVCDMYGVKESTHVSFKPKIFMIACNHALGQEQRLSSSSNTLQIVYYYYDEILLTEKLILKNR